MGIYHVEEVERNLTRVIHKPKPGSEEFRKINKKLISSSEELGMSISDQRKYIREYRLLHPKTKAVARKHKLSQVKAEALSSPTIRKDPHLQAKLAGVMRPSQ
jgi:hypothetical protein